MIIDFTPENEGEKEVLIALNQFPAYTLERCELEAQLYLMLAKIAWRDAERIRQSKVRKYAKTLNKETT